MNLPPYEDYTDGFIVGCAVVKSIENDYKSFSNTVGLIRF